MTNALIINGYETFAGVGEGKLNASLAKYAREALENKGYQVRTSAIEEGYEVTQEHQKLLWANLIYIQTPVYWFGIPGLFKSYLDRVLMMGYGDGSTLTGDGRTPENPDKKYGSGGLLTDKKYMVCSTWNAPSEVFDNPDQFLNGLSEDEVLTPLHKSYQFLGIQKLPSFSFHDIFSSAEVVSTQFKEFEKHLERVL